MHRSLVRYSSKAARSLAALHSAALSPLGREEGAHALLRGQTAEGMVDNIFYYNVDRRGKETIDRPELLPPRMQALGSRTVRIAATYKNHFGRTVEPLLTFGTGLCIGSRIITAFHGVELKAECGQHIGNLDKLYVHPFSAAAVRKASDLERFWNSAHFDHAAQFGVATAAETAAAVLDRDGVQWRNGADIAVLRADSELFDPCIPDLSSDAFALLEGAGIPADSTHYVVGYPAVPQDESFPSLWHGKGVVNRRQLTDIFGGFQQRIISRGKQQVVPPATQPQLPLPLQREPYFLHAHFANALAGMSGGPVCNADGRVVGFHLGGRKDTGAYNMFVGTDHPVVRAALAACGVKLDVPSAT